MIRLISQEWKRNSERKHKGLKFITSLNHVVDCKAESQPWQYLRHSLINIFNSIAHCKFIHNFLCSIIKVHLPGLITLHFGDFHHSIRLHLRQVMEQVLKKCSEHEIWLLRSIPKIYLTYSHQYVVCSVLIAYFPKDWLK